VICEDFLVLLDELVKFWVVLSMEVLVEVINVPVLDKKVELAKCLCKRCSI
jgi:hypothetical protein